MKCKVKWIDQKTGQPTPDDNDAVGVAICTSLAEHQVEASGHVHAYPICEEHLKRMVRVKITDAGTPRQVVTTWQFMRFEDPFRRQA